MFLDLHLETYIQAAFLALTLKVVEGMRYKDLHTRSCRSGELIALSEVKHAINGQTPPESSASLCLTHELSAAFGSLSETNILNFAYARPFAPSAAQGFVEWKEDGHSDN